MGIEATDIYCRHTDEHDFEMAALKNEERCPIGSRHMIVHRTPDHSKAINKLNGPLVIISASGMATGGGVLHHLKQRLPDPSNTVLLSGPSARHARPSAARPAKEIKLLGQVMPVRARIKQLDGFSAHADQAEILRWLRTFKRPREKLTSFMASPLLPWPWRRSSANSSSGPSRSRIKSRNISSIRVHSHCSCLTAKSAVNELLPNNCCLSHAMRV